MWHTSSGMQPVCRVQFKRVALYMLGMIVASKLVKNLICCLLEKIS